MCSGTGPEACCPIIELREYTLHPGARETLIALFDRYFVEGQEGTGIKVIGQFRDLDREDRFVWFRGFESMAARRTALANFYGGPVWAAHKDAANATMIDSDNVLLLKPAFTSSGFDLGGLTRAPREAAMEQRRDNGVALLSVHHLRPESATDFSSIFRAEIMPLLKALGAPAAACFVSEHAENDFPRLPVRQGEHVLVTVQLFQQRSDLDCHRRAIAADAGWRATEERIAPFRSREPEHFRLTPTARSLLGGN
ncbi:NIPSNAP family protein [Mesorhizobium sp. 1B3]|uniref:NIPSNAP family protein n=1 Tax=Mesorhizobium sp. 1B3 TaxID=3243599 RepID=UPI003D96F47D